MQLTVKYFIDGYKVFENISSAHMIIKIPSLLYSQKYSHEQN